VRQDEDVLDTWFSSWLWPLSTLGWPDEDAPDLQAFYPTDVLVSGPDILFFWIARMIMAGHFFEGKAPFHTVYLHGIVRDAQHRKMSKSLGNGIDPLDVVRLYGADALRYTVIAGMGLGVDVVLDPQDLEKSFAPGRNFATKLWNIGRFLLLNVGGDPVRRLDALPERALTRADRWILDRLDAAVAECDAALGPPRPHGATWSVEQRAAGLRLNEYAEAARRFVWNELADWYVESAKARLQEGAETEDREVARAVAVHAFDRALRLLHPMMPFVTEALWQRLPGRADDELLAVAPWPTRRAPAPRGGDEFELVRAAVSAVRQVRADYNLPPSRIIEARVVPPAGTEHVFEEEAALIGRLARCRLQVGGETHGGGAAAHVLLPGGGEVEVPLAGLVDVEKECARLRAELAQLEKQLGALQGRLASEAFVSRAPAAVVEAEREKARDWETRRLQLRDKVSALCGG
jgi:valyl-tRNA synthetase